MLARLPGMRCSGGGAGWGGRGVKNHRQGENALLLLLESFPSAQPSRAEKGHQTQNKRNQHNRVNHNLGLTLSFIKTFTISNSFGSKENTWSARLLSAGAGCRLVVFNYFQRYGPVSIHRTSQRRQTKGTPSGWGTGGELELCSLSTSCCTAPPSGLEASPWASRAPAIPVENQRSRPFQIPFLRAFGCTPLHTVGLQAFLTSVGSTVATPAFTEKAQQQTTVHLMLPWFLSVWENVARSRVLSVNDGSSIFGKWKLGAALMDTLLNLLRFQSV